MAPHFPPSLLAHLAAVAPNVIWLEDVPLLEPGDLAYTAMPAGVEPVVAGDMIIGDVDGVGTPAVDVL